MAQAGYPDLISRKPYDTCSALRHIVERLRYSGEPVTERAVCLSYHDYLGQAEALIANPVIWATILDVAAALQVEGRLGDAQVRSLMADDAFADRDRRALWEKIGCASHPFERAA